MKEPVKCYSYFKSNGKKTIQAFGNAEINL